MKQTPPEFFTEVADALCEDDEDGAFQDVGSGCHCDGGLWPPSIRVRVLSFDE